MKNRSLFDITFVVFVIVNVLAAITLRVAGFERPFDPSTTMMIRMFIASTLVSAVLFAVLAKLAGRKPFWNR